MEDKGVIIQGLPIFNLQFADDVDLIVRDPGYVQAMLNKLRGQWKIWWNVAKPHKAMTFRRSVQSDELTFSIH